MTLGATKQMYTLIKRLTPWVEALSGVQQGSRSQVSGYPGRPCWDGFLAVALGRFILFCSNLPWLWLLSSLNRSRFRASPLDPSSQPSAFKWAQHTTALGCCPRLPLMRASVSNLGPAGTLPTVFTAVVTAGEAAASIAGFEPNPGHRCNSATSWTWSNPCGKVTYLGVVLLTMYIRGQGTPRKTGQLEEGESVCR